MYVRTSFKAVNNKEPAILFETPALSSTKHFPPPFFDGDHLKATQHQPKVYERPRTRQKKKKRTPYKFQKDQVPPDGKSGEKKTPY